MRPSISFRNRLGPRGLGRATLWMHMVRAAPACAALFLTVFATPAGAALVLNEIVYDPEGPDAGKEWVELHNSGTWPAPLEGVRIETGNGSLPDRWTVAWEGRPSDWIEPGGWFVIGDSAVADVPLALSIQNGPDAIRLLREGLILDVVGWGPIEHPEYFESRPAPEVHGTGALARAMDGVDTDDNQQDFESAPPSPGRANRPSIDLVLQITDRGRLLPLPAPNARFAVPLRLSNRGQQSIEFAQISLWLGGNLQNTELVGALDPGAERAESFWMPVSDEPQVVRIGAYADLRGDENPDNDRDSVRVSVGASPLWLAEVHPRPANGSEWVEIVTDRELDTAGWSLEDAGGARLFLADTVLAPGARVLLSASPMPGALSWSGSWPSLNDRPSEGVSADSLFLRDADLVIRDWMTYGDAPQGKSWARLDAGVFGLAAWTVDAVSGDPGVAQEPGNRAVARGVSLERSGAGVWIRVPSETAPLDYRVRILDLQGRTVWRDRGRIAHRGEGRCRWDGRGSDGRLVPQGLYVVETERDWNSGRDRSQLTLVVGR